MKNLLIITQKVDSQDQLLGFFIPWLWRFTQHFSRVTVLCLEKGEYDLPDSVRVFSLGKDRGQLKLAQLWNFYRLTYSLRRDYDVVLVHMNPIWVVVGAWWWYLLGKPISLWYTHKAVTWKLRLAERWTDTIFTASRESFRIPSKKVIVTGHGIDTELFQPDDSQRISGSILTVGRIAPVKNYEVLIDAIRLLRDEGHDYRVTIVGAPVLGEDRKYQEKLRVKIRNLQLESAFIFAGNKQHEELVPIYQRHDLFVHMSNTGSVDKVLLEAMACGMRVVSSNDSARSFLTASMVFKSDDPSHLADAMKRAFSVPVSSELRPYVIAHHGLDRLIRLLSTHIYEVLV